MQVGQTNEELCTEESSSFERYCACPIWFTFRAKYKMISCMIVYNITLNFHSFETLLYSHQKRILEKKVAESNENQA